MVVVADLPIIIVGSGTELSACVRAFPRPTDHSCYHHHHHRRRKRTAWREGDIGNRSEVNSPLCASSRLAAVSPRTSPSVPTTDDCRRRRCQKSFAAESLGANRRLPSVCCCILQHLPVQSAGLCVFNHHRHHHFFTAASTRQRLPQRRRRR